MSLTVDKTKEETKDNKETDTKINKFIDNELTRTYYQNFHLQNYSSKLYHENQKLYDEQGIIKDTNISLQNNLYEKDQEIFEKDKEIYEKGQEIEYLQDSVELLESDIRRLEKELSRQIEEKKDLAKQSVEKTTKRKRLPDELELPKPQKKKIEPTEISYSKDQIKSLFKNINSIDDIINLPEEKYINHNDIMNKLLKLRQPLSKLKEMIGLQNIKDEIFKHIIYFIMNEQELQEQHRLHTVIQGPPGVGKTMFGKILSDIYLAIGLLQKDLFKMVKRSDLIGQYLGQTAIKTQEVIDEAIGGVLFIDEAYSLGNKEKRDMYSKECLDTLNRNLTEKGNKFICIIAGYEKDLNECFFASNSGLERRFTFRYTIDGYDEKELAEIFKLKCSNNNWKYKIDDDELISFFKENTLTHFAGDVDRLLFQSQLMASLRIFKENKENIPKEKELILMDLEESINQVIKEKEKEDISKWTNMYM